MAVINTNTKALFTQAALISTERDFIEIDGATFYWETY